MDNSANSETVLIETIELTEELRHCINSAQAWNYLIFPKSVTEKSIEFFISQDKYSDSLLEELEIVFDKKITLKKIPDDLIKNYLTKHYRNAINSAKQTFANTHIGEDFLNKLILEAKELRSSDIHIEAYDEKCRIRMRIDGNLIERYKINKAEYPPLINKIKIKANLDIAEKRLPQDGRVLFSTGSYKFDIRISVLPTLYGEKIVLRILNKDTSNLDIHNLGFNELELFNYLESIKKHNGIVLISGPTGSGKTTTLYATLKELNKEKFNILTIEDPIEYTLEGVNQVQVHEEIGLSFANALRTFLRQDPDIIMLGEIRDSETAQMAIRAALTGHLVLSTIHTKSAWETITRLIDLKIPNYLLANTLNVSVAQRLLRVLCNHCKEKREMTENLFPRNFKIPSILPYHYIANGCEHCNFTGYHGRKAVYEVIPINDDFSDAIKNLNNEVGELMKEHKIQNLQDNIFNLVAKGECSIEEAYPYLLQSIT